MNNRSDCQQCKGKGWHRATLRDLSGCHSAFHNFGIEAIVPCLHPGCDKGKFNKEQYYSAIGLKIRGKNGTMA